MAGANGDCPAWPTLQVASNPLRSIRPTASTIRWTISSSGNQSIISTGSRKRWRRSGSRKKWAIDTPPRQRTWTESCCRGDVNREKGRLGPSPQRQAAILQQPLKGAAMDCKSFDSPLAAALKGARKQHGLTQHDLAHAAALS